jgi:branched-chain amino acid transport system substrate-binding protein
MRAATFLVPLMAAVVAGVLPDLSVAAERQILIGLDAEFGYADSTSAEAIREGILIAIDEINRAGGVLGGRPLALVEKANHSVPARSIENIKELAAHPDVVAVFCGRFSPTVLESLSTVHRVGLPLLDPWSAADGIVDNGFEPNYVFRLSLRDGWAISVMLRHAQELGARSVGLMLLNTSWGRSNVSAAERYVEEHRGPKIVGVRWFNWNDKTFLEQYRSLLGAGAQAVLLVSNANEAQILVREMAALPARERLPVISHWGITGGRMVELAGPALAKVELSVVQTYSFIGAKDAAAQRVVAAHQRLFGSGGARAIRSPVGVAHAYDLTHILARAIAKAGSPDRRAIREALELLAPYQGLIRRYAPPFTPTNHEALTPAQVFMAEYADDGALVPIVRPRRRALAE